MSSPARLPSLPDPHGAGRSAPRRLLSVLLAVVFLMMATVAGAGAVQSTTQPAANPPMATQCELDFAISLDLSNSVTDPQLAEMRAAVVDLVTELAGYPIRFSIHNFASRAPSTTGASNAALPLTELTGAGISEISQHVNGIERPAPANGGTNWDAAFRAISASSQKYDAVLFVTDGNPTQYLNAQGGVAGPGSSTDTNTITAAVRSANTVKQTGTRIVPIGVSDNLSGANLAAFREHITQISGTVENSDYFLSNFAQLARPLVEIANTNCAKIDLAKDGQLADGASPEPGEVVEYSFTAKNTGSVTLTDVAISDPKPGLSALSYGAWPGAPGVLEPGQSVTATASYTLTAADITAGIVRNTASVIGSPPAGEPITDEDPADVPVVQNAAVEVLKTGDLTAGATGRVGDVIDYDFTVTNTGNVRLTGVSLVDQLPGLSAITFGSWPGAVGSLAPGQTVTATATYTLNQADINRGEVVNTVTVTGKPPVGPSIQDSDTHTVTIAGAPEIALIKSGELDSGATGVAGDVVAYDFTITNTGAVTLSDVSVTDPLPGLSAISYGAWPAATGVLQPGQSVTATATYVLKQADIDRGALDNTATANGTPPTGPRVQDSDDHELPLIQRPLITVVKGGALAAGSNGLVGDRVEYDFTVTNTGNVTLTDIGLADPLPGLSAISYGAWPAATGTLAPGQSVTATATYSLTQADVDRGHVDNTVTVSGTSPAGDPVSNDDDKTVEITPGPSLDVVKRGELAHGSTGRSGDVVEYDFTLTNTGNVTLRDVELADPLPGLSAITYGTWPTTAGTLAPGQSVTATATYALTQADVDRGHVDNTATVTGTPPSGDPVDAGDDNTVALPQTPLVRVVKTGSFEDGATGRTGDKVDYLFTLTNTGNVTLSDVELADPLPGLSAITYGTWPTTAGTLAPGQSVTATATYALTQADVDRGHVDNTATVTGTSPSGTSVGDSDDDTVDVPQAPAIKVAKTGGLAAGATGKAGDKVDYLFTATNTGNVTLTDIGLVDPLPGLSAISYGRWPTTAGTLAPGQSVTATATYSLTQADVDRGRVDNTVTASGTLPAGDPVEGKTGHELRLTQLPVLDLVKTGALSAGSTGTAGDKVDYRFIVTNKGNVTLKDVQLSDPLPGLSSIAFGTWPAGPGVLAPGESVSATASYALTQADVDRGEVDNTATTSGTPPTGDPVTDTDQVKVTTPQGPAVQLVKSANLIKGAESKAGDKVRYTFDVTNTGSTTLRAVSVVDTMVGLSEVTMKTWPGQDGVLAPGETVTGVAEYTLAQADIDRGHLTNAATVHGTSFSGSAVTDDDEERTPLPARPGVTIDKQAAFDGDHIRYSFTVVNTGTVTLTDVRITDELKGLSKIEYGEWPHRANELAPGERVTATATYTPTDADRERGHVDNEASVLGRSNSDRASASAVDEVRIFTRGLPETGASSGLAALLALGLLALIGGGYLLRRTRAGA